MKVFRFEGALLFASFDYFRSKLIEKTGIDPIALRKQQKLESKRAANTLEQTISLSTKSSSEQIAEDAARDAPLPPIPGSTRPQPQRSSGGFSGEDSSSGTQNRNRCQIPVPPPPIHIDSSSFISERSSGAVQDALSQTVVGSTSTATAVDPKMSSSDRTVAADRVELSNVMRDASGSASGFVNPLKKTMTHSKKKLQSSNKESDSTDLLENVHHIILDASVWAFIDDTAVSSLIEVK